MVSFIIQLRPEVEKLFTVIDLPLPDDVGLFDLQREIPKFVSYNSHYYSNTTNIT